MFPRIICYKDLPTFCRPLPAKTKAVKYWCYVCGRYILPDKDHKVLNDSYHIDRYILNQIINRINEEYTCF
jgi:hypothetical protein